MKKIFLFAALAGIVFASCQKEASVASVENDGLQEVTFSALSKGYTKSVLGSGDSFDTPGMRTIIAAGAMQNAGTWVDFLEPTNFKQDGTTSKWVATPKVYYPLGGANADFKFLAYSETAIPASGSTRQPVTARWYGSTEVEINVDEKCDTNDVVYAGFKGVKQDVAPATFKHSQALVTVYIRTNQDTIKINKIGFEDVKTSGTLSLKRSVKTDNVNTDSVTVKWLFNAGCNCHFAEMGDYKLADCSTITPPADAITAGMATFTDKIAENAEHFFTKYVKDTEIEVGGSPVTGEYRNQGLGTWINNTGCVFDRLFPAQELETKTMVINYTLGDITTDARLTFTGEDNQPKWEAGKRYVYDITVKPAEIVIDPSVEEAWQLKEITGEYN